MGGWVDPRANLYDVEDRKVSPLLGLEFRALGHPTPEPVTIPIALCQLGMSAIFFGGFLRDYKRRKDIRLFYARWFYSTH
jgi:hypothetical protein